MTSGDCFLLNDNSKSETAKNGEIIFMKGETINNKKRRLHPLIFTRSDVKFPTRLGRLPEI